MTHESISSRWIRGGVAVAALVAVLLAILLLPEVTRGQDGQQEPSDGQAVESGATGPVFQDGPADLNHSPYVLGADAFIPTGNTDGLYYLYGWSGYQHRLTSATGYVCYIAPIYLDDGVTINNYEVYAVDNDGNYIQTRLYRKKYNYGAGAANVAAEAIGFVNSNGASANVVKWTSNNINSVVDNSTYHYYIESCPWSPEHQVYSYRVNWTK